MLPDGADNGRLEIVDKLISACAKLNLQCTVRESGKEWRAGSA